MADFEASVAHSSELLAPLTFTDQKVFDAEIRQLFRSGHQFVGLTSELANDKDFVTLDLPGLALIVQNFQGELRAFSNVCSHRFARLQWEERGNRPLACRYHGWSYRADGCPVIPRRASYDLPHDDALLSLATFEVETCGAFVFVRFPGARTTLETYLGPYWPQLERLSENLGPEVFFHTVPHRANWKILVENVLDNYHCQLLHQDTFVAFGFCRLPLESVEVHHPHSSFHVPRKESDRDALRRRAFSHLKDRGIAHDSFHHMLIFPNLFIGSNEGMSFYIGQAIPVAADQTLLRVRYLEPKVDLKPGQRARQDTINEQTRANGLAVIEEDRPVLESVQRGAETAVRPGLVAREETRIHAFVHAYRAMMAQ